MYHSCMVSIESTKQKGQLEKLKSLNSLLEIVILLVALFVILGPILPAIESMFKKDASVARPDEFTPKSLFENIDSTVNYLIVPSLGIEKEIIETDTIRKVHENVWRRPQGSSPSNGSNTILVAHRYANIGGERASTFYALPDIVIGADIYIRWEGVVYHYQATETKIVLPTEIEIEEPTNTPILTMYTCTPLWKADKRFVVTAPLIAVYP